MGIVFIHTADWHIGRRYAAFGEGLASALDEARLDAIDRIGEAATEAGAGHVLVAGDVFDRGRLPDRTLRQAIERLRRHPAVRWWLIPGNHDHARSEVWSKLDAIGLPANVRVLLEPTPIDIAPGVVVLPAPLRSAAAAGDPTAWMDGAGSVATDGRPGDTIRIGLAHGSIRATFGSGETSVPSDPRRATLAKLDYLALGDWHGAKKIDDRTWYSGSPEPDGYGASGSGSALVVAIDGPGATPTVRQVETARFHWVDAVRTIASFGDIEALDAIIDDAVVPNERVLLRLELSGRLDPTAMRALDSWRARTEARVRHSEIATGKVHARAGADDLARLDNDRLLAPIVRRLQAQARGPEASGLETEPASASPEHAAAALRLLAELTAVEDLARETTA